MCIKKKEKKKKTTKTNNEIHEAKSYHQSVYKKNNKIEEESFALETGKYKQWRVDGAGKGVGWKWGKWLRRKRNEGEEEFAK